MTKRLLPLSLSLSLLLSLMVHVSGSASRSALSIVLDGRPLTLSVPAYTEDGRAMVPLRDVAEALGLTVLWDGDARTAYLSTGAAPLSQRTVALDPGHGGSATGAEYGGVRESALNLSIALKTAEALRREGVRVVLTREEDRELSLYDRAGLAGEQGADLLVSIHCNASTAVPDARGVYTAYHPDRPGSRLLADALQEAVTASAGAEDMGVERRPDLAVLRTAAMPAALVECGFMSTPEELALLQSEDYQQRLAQGIARGVLSCLQALP